MSTARLPAARRRRQLLDVAVQVFGVRGFHGTSMNDVATAAGVTKPVLYQHFGSKRDLYREVLEDGGAQLRERLAKATADADGPRAQVEAGMGAYFEFVAENEPAFTLLFGGGTRRDPEFRAIAAAVEEDVAAFIAALIDVPGLSDDERALYAHGVVGLAEGMSRHWIEHRNPADHAALTTAVSRMAWGGLRSIRPL
ncbi:MAG: TetR/AcrR family transcriptional regulator [Actinomycetota bacterium]|nr:TetR/AcrR family transcriptional regulator [Actinomycetota bacterium]